MFSRQHHQRIEKLLRMFDRDMLEKTGCLFGGGTAIVLLLDEYRESVDVDFLCASQEGYRFLRNVVSQSSLGALLREPVTHLRDVRTDRYGIRTFLQVDDQPIKVEIVSEGRIGLSAASDPSIPVPILSRVDMYAEKLLANTDRCYDRSTLSRDMIDLAMMIDGWGEIPAEAWDKATDAYGPSVEKAYAGALEMLSDRDYLSACLAKMHMSDDLVKRVRDALDLPAEDSGRLRDRP